MSLRKKKRNLTDSLVKKSKEFYKEWIVESDPKEDCIQQCELIALINHLDITFELIYQLDKLLPPMCPDIARWYGVKWNKELPCKVNYGDEIVADIQNEMYEKFYRNYHIDKFTKSFPPTSNTLDWSNQ